MSDWGWGCLVICVAIGSCTVNDISRLQTNAETAAIMTPMERCLRDAIVHTAREACFKAFVKAKP